MLTYEDCLAVAGITGDEAEAIAAHERLPVTLAVELGSYLRRCPGGEHCIRTMLQGEIAAARARRDVQTAVRLRRLLRASSATSPIDDGVAAQACLPKLLFPGDRELDLRACSSCDRLRPRSRSA